MRPRTHRSGGFALILVLVIVGVATILGVTYASTTSIKLAGTENMLGATRAQALAESGVEHALYFLQYSPWVLTETGGAAVGPYIVDAYSDRYYCHAVEEAEQGVYLVTGTGEVAGGLQRQSQARVRVGAGYSQMVRNLEPVAYWRLGESSGSIAADEMENHDGRYRNHVSLGETGAINGDPDSAAGFDGVNDYVDAGTFEVSGRNLTILLWLRQDDTGWGPMDRRAIIKAGGRGGNDISWSIGSYRFFFSSRLRFTLQTSSHGTETLSASANLLPLQWTFVAATYDGSRMRLYQSAQQVAIGTKRGPIRGPSDGDVWIGACPPNSSNAWLGGIDEVAVFDKVLTPEQIDEIYHARAPTLELLSWQQ